MKGEEAMEVGEMGEGKLIETSVETEVSVEQGREAGEPYMVAGLQGGTDASALLQRRMRQEGYKDRNYYREAIPCDRCGECLELRRFGANGRPMRTVYYCVPGAFETDMFSTCNAARLAKKGRRKVIYDTTNAPIGFTEGLSELNESNRPIGEKMVSEKERRGRLATQYRGGDGGYERKGEERGGGGMPRMLVN